MHQATDGLPGPPKDLIDLAEKAADADGPGAAAPTIPDAEIVAQLELIVASPALETSERNRRFLRYVVEQTLAGRADRIKAYSIATDVFGRPEDFDPASDPIIRIEASRLRRALDHYYLTAGRQDPVRIAMPKGSYVPSFGRGGGASEPAAASADGVPGLSPPGQERSPAAWRAISLRALPAIAAAVVLTIALGAFIAWRSGGDGAAESTAAAAGNHAAVLVLPFENDADDQTQASLSRGFTRQVVAALIRYNELAIYTGDQPPRAANASSGEPKIDFIVTGATARSGDRLRVSIQLADGRIGRQLWAESFETAVPEGGQASAEADLVGRVVRALAEPTGAVFVELRKAIASKAIHHTTSFECVLRLQVYWKAPTSDLFGFVRDCLEKAIRDDANYADAHAGIALILGDAVRLGLDRTIGRAPALERAALHAQRAVDLAPNSVRGHQAVSIIHWLQGNAEASIVAGERALKLNPNNSEVMAEVGMRHAMRADWQRGLPLIREAYARDPDLWSGPRLIISLHHYINGRYREAIAEARKYDVATFTWPLVLQAVAYARLDDHQAAGKLVKRILEIEPRFAETAEQDMLSRNLHPDLVHALSDGLENAGLKVMRVARK